MGQYRMRAKSRHFADIFKEKIEDKVKEKHSRRQRDELKSSK